MTIEDKNEAKTNDEDEVILEALDNSDKFVDTVKK